MTTKRQLEDLIKNGKKWKRFVVNHGWCQKTAKKGKSYCAWGGLEDTFGLLYQNDLKNRKVRKKRKDCDAVYNSFTDFYSLSPWAQYDLVRYNDKKGMTKKKFVADLDKWLVSLKKDLKEKRK